MLSGFEYLPDFLGARECATLLEAVAAMPLAQAQYKQFTARRRVIHFGGRYDFSNSELVPGGPLPDILVPLRERIGAAAGVEPQMFTHAMVAEYAAGVQLGWHRDVPDFDIIAGVSLGSTARMQFRPYPPKELSRKQYRNVLLDRRIALLVAGPGPVGMAAPGASGAAAAVLDYVSYVAA